MLSHLLRSCAVAALLGLLCVPGTTAEKPTKAAIAAKAKAATARLDGRPAGTAFCVHPSGLFVTGAQAVRDLGDKIPLVLDSGLKTEAKYEARVLRLDRELGLVVLAVAAKGDLPTLALGSSDGLAELADVITLGFPLARKDSPAVNVDTANVKALHRKNDELHRIELSVALDSGHMGGPVLDESGKVV